jgi:hypothetical protein
VYDGFTWVHRKWKFNRVDWTGSYTEDLYGNFDCAAEHQIVRVEEEFTYTLHNSEYVGEQPQAFDYQLTSVNITLFNHNASETYRQTLNGTCCVDWSTSYEHAIPDTCNQACGLPQVSDGFPLSKTRVAKVRVRGISADPQGVKAGFTSQYCEMRVSDFAGDADSVHDSVFSGSTCSHEQVRTGETSKCVKVADLMRDCSYQVCNGPSNSNGIYRVLVIVCVILGPLVSVALVWHFSQKYNARDRAKAAQLDEQEWGAEPEGNGLELATSGTTQAAVM